MSANRKTAPAGRRIRREMKTVRVMIGIYCRGNHGPGPDLCAECRELFDYAEKRVDHCPFLADKPTCVRCPVHCYKPEMRERIRAVMRYAGPRMAWRHPWLSVMHFLDGVWSRQTIRNGRIGRQTRPGPRR